MSSVTLDSVARDDAEHRLVIAEGLILSLGSGQLALDAARTFLETPELTVAEARDELTALIEDLRGGLRIFKPEMHPRGRGGKFRKSTLIAVDVQKDFLPGGALGVARGDEVVKPLLEAAKHVDVVVASGDQHPADHVSFVAEGGQWPPHAVRGTPGAEIHPKIKAAADIIVDKGTKRGVDAYSAFDGTGLADKLRARGVGKVVVGGLATDYCVKATALDAIKEGFDVEVLPEASRAVNLNIGDGERAIEDMRKAGAKIVHNVKEADTSADSPMAAAEPSEKAKRRRRRRRPKEERMQEATVVNGVATPWGGANPGAEAAVMRGEEGDDATSVGTKPPNLRDSEGWAACGNCVFYGKGQCNLYGIGRDGSPPGDAIHRGGYPVDVDDLCDSHTTLTPEDERKYAQAQKYVGRYMREGRQLAEAASRGDMDTATRLRARLEVTGRHIDELGLTERLEEFGIHVHLAHAPSLHMGKFEEGKHPRSHGKFASKGGLSERERELGRLEDHRASIEKLRDGDSHPVAHGVTVHRLGSAYEVRQNGRPSGGDTQAATVAEKAYALAKKRNAEIAAERTTQPSRRELERRLSATERVNPNANVGKVRKSAAERGRAQTDSTRRKLRMTEGDTMDVLREAMLEEVKSDAYPGLDRSPKQNWVDKAGGLPRYISRIAKHLHYEKGKPIGQSIAIAVNVVKKMCASGELNFPGHQSANPKSRAEACKAVAQWEAKKARSHAQEAETWLQQSFVRALREAEEDYRPIPPSARYIGSLLREIAAIDGPDFYVGFSELDEAAELIDEMGIERVVERELVEVGVLQRLGVHFDPRRHPRAAKGRAGGGRFVKVLERMTREAQPKGRTFSRPKGGTTADAGGKSQSVFRGGPGAKEGRSQLRDSSGLRHRPSGADAGKGAAPAAAASANRVYRHGDARRTGRIVSHTHRGAVAAGARNVYDEKMEAKTVEQHFATDESGQEHIFPDGLFTKAAQSGHRQFVSGQRSPGVAVDGADALTVDMAIGGTLSTFPNLDDWSLSSPKTVNGVKVWTVHVKLKDGATHDIEVDENGHTNLVAPEPKPVLSTAAKTPTTTGYAATGDTNVVSHMLPGTVFKGHDGHLYKHHGDEWMKGKKGPLKGAHIENLDTGVHKTTPYFAIHGIEYDVMAPAGSFTPKPKDAPTSTSKVFADLVDSVKGQHGALSSVAGKNVVFTGTLPGHTRNEAKALVKAAGGTPQDSVTSATHVLVTGEKVGATKINAAKKKGVTVIPWDEFKSLVESATDPNVAKLALVRARLEECDDTAEVVRLRARERLLAARVGPDADRGRLLVEAFGILELQERKFSAAKRKQLAAEGKALADGSYPIENEEDLHNAKVLANSGHGNVAAAKRHIRKRARALGVKAAV